MIVEGNESATPTPITLTSGTAGDSTVIGGEVTFFANGSFNVSSTVAAAGGSLFSVPESMPPTAAPCNPLTMWTSVRLTEHPMPSDPLTVLSARLTASAPISAPCKTALNRPLPICQNVSENLSAARSRILDADIAQETSAMTKNNILQQAGVAILAQANTTPQLALKLLQG